MKNVDVISNNMFLITESTETKDMLGAFSQTIAFSRYRRSGWPSFEVLLKYHWSTIEIPLKYLWSTLGVPLKCPPVKWGIYRNTKLWEKYSHRRREVAEENHNQSNERMLFHGSPFIQVNFLSKFKLQIYLERNIFMFAGDCTEGFWWATRVYRGHVWVRNSSISFGPSTFPQ